MKVRTKINDPESGTELNIEFDCGCVLTETHNYEPKISSVCDEHSGLADMSASNLLDNAAAA